MNVMLNVICKHSSPMLAEVHRAHTKSHIIMSVVLGNMDKKPRLLILGLEHLT